MTISAIRARSFVQEYNEMVASKPQTLYGSLDSGYTYLKTNNPYSVDAAFERQIEEFTRKLMNKPIREIETAEEIRRKEYERIDRDRHMIDCQLKHYMNNNIFLSGQLHNVKKELKECKEKMINFGMKNVYFNEPYVIVIWEDKSKTMVRCGENDIYDPEKGLAMCIAKKALGTNTSKSNYYDAFKKFLPEKVENDTVTD